MITDPDLIKRLNEAKSQSATKVTDQSLIEKLNAAKAQTLAPPAEETSPAPTATAPAPTATAPAAPAPTAATPTAATPIAAAPAAPAPIAATPIAATPTAATAAPTPMSESEREAEARRTAIQTIGTGALGKAAAGKETGFLERTKDIFNTLSLDSLIGAVASGNPLATIAQEKQADFAMMQDRLYSDLRDKGFATREEANRIAQDAGKEYAWTTNDTDRVRQLSKGELVVNPSRIFGQDLNATKQDIEAANATPEQKEAALRSVAFLRQRMSDQLEQDLYSADPEFRKTADNWQGDKQSLMDFYTNTQKDRGFFSKSLDAVVNGLRTGGIGVAGTVVGTGAGLAALTGAEGVAGSLGGAAETLRQTTESQQKALEQRGVTGVPALLGDITNTVTQMAPMLIGGQYAQGLKGISQAAVGGASVYGWSAAQGYSSKLDDAINMRKEELGRDLTEQEMVQTLSDGKTQLAAFANGVQTAALSKILGGGAERAAIGAVDDLTIRDFLTRGGRQALMDAGFKNEMKAIGRRILGDAADETVEEGVNQLLDSAISASLLGKDVMLGDLIEETFTAAALGGLVGGTLPQVRKSRSLVTPAVQEAAPQAAQAAMNTPLPPAPPSTPTGGAPTGGVTGLDGREIPMSKAPAPVGPNGIPLVVNPVYTTPNGEIRYDDGAWTDSTGRPLNATKAATLEEEFNALPVDTNVPLTTQAAAQAAPAAPTPVPAQAAPAQAAPITPTQQTDATTKGNQQQDNQQQYQPTGEGRTTAETGSGDSTVQGGTQQEAQTGTGTLNREELKSTFNLTDDQAEVAEQIARAFGLTPERVLLEREKTAPTQTAAPEAAAPAPEPTPTPAPEVAPRRVGGKLAAGRNVETPLGQRLRTPKPAKAATPAPTPDPMAVVYELTNPSVGEALDLDTIELQLDLLDYSASKGKQIDWSRDRQWLPNLPTSTVAEAKELLETQEGRNAIRAAVEAKRKAETPAPAKAAAPAPTPTPTPAPAPEPLRKSFPKDLEKLATSPTREGIENVIAKFYGGERKTLVPIEGRDGYYNVVGGKGVLGPIVVETTRGFAFGTEPTTSQQQISTTAPTPNAEQDQPVSATGDQGLQSSPSEGQPSAGEQLDVAKKVIGLMRGGQFVPRQTYNVWDLAGDRYKATRQEIMSLLNGKKTPVAKSGVTAIESKLAEILGVNRNNLEETLRGIADTATNKWSAIDAITNPADKGLRLEAIASNRFNTKATEQDLIDVLDRLDETTMGGQAWRVAYAVAQNPAASPETKARAEALRENWMRSGRMEEETPPTPTTPPPQDTAKGEFFPNTGITILPSDQSKNADYVLYVTKGKNYHTLWGGFRDNRGNVRYNYLTILSQDADEAIEKANAYARQMATGEKLSVAFAGRFIESADGAKTLAVADGIFEKGRLPDIEKAPSTPLGEQLLGGNSSASNILIKDLWEQAPDQANWIIANGYSKRLIEIAGYLKTQPEWLEMQDERELESARISAYEKRRAEREAGKDVPVTTLIRKDGEIVEVDESGPAQQSRQKLTERKAKDQVVDIVPPATNVPNLVPRNLADKMFPMQVSGANATLASMKANGVALNGDGAGVGKTRQILAVADYYAKQGKQVIIITENAAIGKPWEKKSAPKLGGSMAKDSEAMGISLGLLGEQQGDILVTTYNRVKATDIPDGAILIFDESHNLANTFGANPDEKSAELKQWETKFRDMLPRAEAVAYYSATPADKPHQLAYLHKVLGFDTPAEYLDAALDAGMALKTVKRGNKEQQYYDVPKGAKKTSLYNWVNGRMIEAGNQGRFIKREISYEGTDVQFEDISGSDVNKNPWAQQFQDALADMQAAQNRGMRLLAPDSYVLYAAELSKIGRAVELAKREIQAGRKVVIYFSRIRDMEIKARSVLRGADGELMYGDPEVVGIIPSPVEMIKTELQKDGIAFAELHGKSGLTSQQAQNAFAGTTNVLLASVESGGTGINLDDTKGDNPRTEIFMFAPYRGISTVQAMGRIWRASTIQDDNNPNRYAMIVASDVTPDAMRSAVLAKKLQLMNAAIGGTAVARLPMSKTNYDPKQLKGLEIAEDGSDSSLDRPRTGILRPVKVDWKLAKSGRYYSDATADVLEWEERGGAERVGIDVRVFKGDRGWMVIADRPYSPEEFTLPEEAVPDVPTAPTPEPAKAETPAPTPTETPAPTPELLPTPTTPPPQDNPVSTMLAEGAAKIGKVESINPVSNTAVIEVNGVKGTYQGDLEGKNWKRIDDAPIEETHEFITANPDADVVAHGTVEVMSAAELEKMILTDISDNQARLRTDRNVNSEAQIANIAANPKPQLLLSVDSPVTDGAPTVYKGQVLAGNGRSMGIVRAYQSGRADKYRDAVIARAKRDGIEIDENIKDPVLIRKVNRFTGGTAQQFADYSNATGMLQMGAVELAKVDAEILGDFSAVESTESNDFTAATIRSVAAAFDKDGRVKVTRESNGEPSRKQVSDRIRNAALAGIFNKAGKPVQELLGVMESDEGVRLVNIIATKAPRLISLDPDLSLANEISDAVIELQSGLKAVKDGKFKNLQEWRDNRGAELIERTEITPRGLWLLDKMVEAQKKPTVLKEFFDTYLDQAEAEQSERNDSRASGDFFGGRTEQDVFSKMTGTEEFALESVTQDQLDAEAAAQKQRDQIAERQARPLTGGVDLTADMFGEGDTPLFNERRDTTRFQEDLTAEDEAYFDAIDRGDMETAQRMVDDYLQEIGGSKFSMGGEQLLVDPEFGRINVYGNEPAARQTSRSLQAAPTLGDTLRDIEEIRGRNAGLQTSATPEANQAALIRPKVVIHDGYNLDNTDIVNEVKDASSLGYGSIVEVMDVRAVRGIKYEERPDGYYVDIKTDELIDPRMAYDYENRRLRTWAETQSIYGDLLERTDMSHKGVRVITWGDTSTDPVTYDADGNPIPLSQRFNPLSQDIRYQRRRRRGQNAKGLAKLLDDGRVLLKGLLNPDFTTAVHEMAHAFEMTGYTGLTDEEVATLKNWAGDKNPNDRKMMETKASEKFARGWERYLAEGQAPFAELQAIFDKISKWMLETYKTIKGTQIDVEISSEVRAIFDKIAARMVAPAAIVTPAGNMMVTEDGSPVAPAIDPATLETIETDEQVIGVIRHILENPTPTPPQFNTPEDEPTLYALQRARADQEAILYGYDTAAWNQAAQTFAELWDTVTSEPAGTGEAKLNELMMSADPDRALTATEIARFTLEGLRRKKVLDRALEELQTAISSGNAKLVNEKQDFVNAASARYQTMLNQIARSRTTAGRALNAWKFALKDDFSQGTLYSRALVNFNSVRVANGKPAVDALPQEEAKAIAQFAEKMAKMQEEIDELKEAQRLGVDRAAEQQAMIDALRAERDAAKDKKSSKVQEATRRVLVNKVRQAAKEARERLGLPPADENTRYQLDSSSDPTWRDRVIVLAEVLIADSAMGVARFADRVRSMFGEAYAAVAGKLRNDVEEYLRPMMEDVSGTEMPTPQKVMESIDGSAELTNEVVYQLAKAHVYAGARNTEVLDRVFADLQEFYPDLTREDVAQLFTRYGETRAMNPSEEAKALRAAKSLELVQRQIDNLLTDGVMQRTGTKKDDPSVELRALRKKRDDLAKDLGYVPVDPETQLSSAQTAAKKRMKNEMEELQNAIDTNTPIVRVKRGVKYTEDMEQMRSKLEELRKSYEEIFGQQRTPQERMAAIIKDLDRRIAKERELINKGILKEEVSQPAAIDSPEISARRELLKELKRQKYEAYDALHPNERALNQAMEAAQKALERRQKIVDEGLPAAKDKQGRGANVTPTAELEALWEAADDLDVLIAEMRKNRPLTPAQQLRQLDNAYDAAVKTREKLKQRIADGDLVPASGVKPTVEERTRLVREENAELRKTITQMQRDAGVGAFAYDAREAKKVAALEKSIAELKRKRAVKDFSKRKTTEPVTSERIRTLELIKDYERREYEQERAQAAFKTLGLGAKAYEYAVAAWHARQILNLSGDFGVLNRNLGKVQLFALWNDVKQILRNGRATKLSEDTILGKVIAKGYEAFMDEKAEERLYSEMAVDPRYAKMKEDGFTLVSPHESSHEFTGSGRVRINPMAIFNDKVIATLAILKGILRTGVSASLMPVTGGAVWKEVAKGIAQTAGGVALAVGGARYAKRVERANRVMMNVARWALLDAANKIVGNVDPSMQADYKTITTEAMMTLTGQFAGRSDITKKLKNSNLLSVIFSFPQYVITNMQSAVGLPLWSALHRANVPQAAFAKLLRQQGPEVNWDAVKAVSVLQSQYYLGAAAKIWFFALLLGAWDDEDKESTGGVVTNPLHKYFGSLKIGNTFIDLNPRASKWISDIARALSDSKLDESELKKGYLIPRPASTYDKQKMMKDLWYNQLNMNWKAINDMAISKNLYQGGNIGKMGMLYATDAVLTEYASNMTARDIKKMYQLHGPVKGGAISSLILLGANASIRETEDEREKRKTEESKKYKP